MAFLEMAWMSNKKFKNFPRRGDVYWVNLDPAFGSEVKKTRPGVIVSNDIGNEVSDVVMIAPITSKVKHIYPFEVKVEIQSKSAKIMLNQCRAVDKKRILQKIGTIEQNVILAIDEALKVVFGLS